MSDTNDFVTFKLAFAPLVSLYVPGEMKMRVRFVAVAVGAAFRAAWTLVYAPFAPVVLTNKSVVVVTVAVGAVDTVGTPFPPCTPAPAITTLGTFTVASGAYAYEGVKTESVPAEMVPVQEL